jgi:hypothetical protein
MAGRGRTVVGLVVAAAGCLVLAGTVPAQETTSAAESHSRCSDAALVGEYAVKGDGFVSSGPPPAPLAPFAVVSLMTFDGQGGLSNRVSASFNGLIRQNTVSGRYTVDADCTGTISVTLPEPPFRLNFSLVMAGARSRTGDEFYFIQTDPGTVVTHIAKRLR